MAFDGSRSSADIAPAVGLDLMPRTATGPGVGVNALAAPSLGAPIDGPTLSSVPNLGAPNLAPSKIEPRKQTATEAFRSGARALSAGDMKGGVTALEYAAANGHAAAQWKLGRMYAVGEGVKQDDVRAFEYFRDIAGAHADESPGTPQARFVANAFVSLGGYYLDGIANSYVKPDPDRARDMFAYAASYYGDPDAQYQLGRMYLDGVGGGKEPRQAARWLQLSANKGQYQAQAVLGALLFKGDGVPRQAARGLMWLTLASDSAGKREPWIADLHAAASDQATVEEQALALRYIEQWIRGRRE
jgi:hypothetical protein